VADEVPNGILASVLSAQSQLQTIITVLIALVIGFAADFWGVGVAITAVSLILGLIVLVIQWYKKSNK
jgi:hypothetical protein